MDRRGALGACVALCAAWPTAGSAVVAYAPAAAAQAKPSSTGQRLERRFLQVAAANLRFQAEASRLAQARSNNAAVRDVATSLLAHQREVQPELLRLLHVRGMAWPISSPPQDKVLKQLSRLSGAKFDRLYVEEVVVRSHQADVANYEKLAAEAEDPVLRAWVERELPTLRRVAKTARCQNTYCAL